MNIACLCEAGFQIICPQICNDFASVFLNKLNLVGQVQCLNACRPQWDSQSMPFFVHNGKHQGIKEQLIPTLVTMIRYLEGFGYRGYI